MHNDHTNSPTPPQSNPEPTSYWVAARVSSDGGVIGVFVSERTDTFDLCWVNDDPDDPRPAQFDIADLDLVLDLLTQAKLSLDLLARAKASLDGRGVL